MPAIRVAPGFTVPIDQATGSYWMQLVVPRSFTVQGLRAKVESETWQFAPNSGALKETADALLYEFAVQPKEGGPQPGTIKVTVANVTDPAGKGLEPITLRVYGPSVQLPACAVPAASPSPSAGPKKP